MNLQNNIEDLLKKFNEDNLSPREAKEFAEILKEGDTNEELKKILTSNWENTENAKIDAPTLKLLERLKASISNTEMKYSMNTRQNALRVFMKYAAVVLITFGITWFAKDLKSGDYISDAIKGTTLPYHKASHANEISVLYGSKSKITLPDGSTVNLNSGSTLRYPAEFDSENRNVSIEGEAYFDVKKDSHHPFLVKTNGIIIRVLGTKFNVKSYPEEKTVETTLVSGKVELYANNTVISNRNRLMVLKPNQQAVFEVIKGQKDSILSLVCNQNVDVSSIISWKDNRLKFCDEKFADLAQKLERWYNVDIDIKDQELQSTPFSGVFEKETVEQSLNALRLAAPFKYKMEKNQIIILRK